MRLLRRRADGKEGTLHALPTWKSGKSGTAEHFVRTDVERQKRPILAYAEVLAPAPVCRALVLGAK